MMDENNTQSNAWRQKLVLCVGVFLLSLALKVQWEHYKPEEATWELEDAMRLAHPFLFNPAEH